MFIVSKGAWWCGKVGKSNFVKVLDQREIDIAYYYIRFFKAFVLIGVLINICMHVIMCFGCPLYYLFYKYGKAF